MGTRTASVIGAGVATIATGLVGALALMGSRIPLMEYLLFPGGMAAWAYKGDNYVSGNDFLHHMIVFGVIINGLAGAILGALVAQAGRRWVRGRSKAHGDLPSNTPL